MEKHVLVKKNYKWLKHGFATTSLNHKRQSMEWKRTESSVKKVLGAVVFKEGDADSFLGYERTHDY